MLNIIERIKKGQFWQFPGGVKPEGRKSLSNEHEIERLPLPDKLYIPVKQHVGVEGRLSAEPGNRVLKGQALSHSMNPLAVPVHAPTSGEIIEITHHVSAHPSGIAEKTIVLQPDGLEEWVDLKPIPDYQSLNRASLVEVICAAGISGMGGAGFPTHIKLSSGKNIEFLIINGVECEPYITSDDRLMREHAWQIRQGIDVLCHILKPQHVLIAIEDNKPEAFAAMEIAFQDNNNYTLCAVETKYPAGGEKQLIQVLTGKEVPSGGLPIDIGVMMQNVGTCFAVADAILTGRPLIERVVTVTGEAIEQPQNYWVPFGAPAVHLVQTAGYKEREQRQPRYIMGGPMMGFTLHSPDVPIVKITNCILVPSDKELPPPGQELPCIRCGACADACPAGLLPQQLYWHSKGYELDKAKELNLFDCIECGACAFVCPSQIPLVHYYRGAKAEIRIQEQEAHQAAKAKDRFEARNTRLERDKQEREAKMRQSAEARANRNNTKLGVTQSDEAESPQKSSSNDRVAAALARAKAKKAAQMAAQNEDVSSGTPEQSDDAGDAQKSKVAAAIARAKARKEAQNKDSDQSGSSETAPADASEVEESSEALPMADTNVDATSEEDEKKRKVAEAVARAKAKREARMQPDNDTVESSTDVSEREADTHESAENEKKRKVSEAIARAKAKREARMAQEAVENAHIHTETPTDQAEFQLEEPSEEVEQPYLEANNTGETPESDNNAESNTLVTTVPAESKQDKIAAAIARAKAKKAARESGENPIGDMDGDKQETSDT